MKTELGLTIAAGEPLADAEDVRAVVAVLAGADRWMTAGEICAAIDGRESEAGKRLVRKIAAQSGAQIVSFPGSPGYRLLRRCTIAEVQQCVDAFRSQADDMQRRALSYLRAMHARQAEPAAAPVPASQLEMLPR